jgi:hypothetical protein
MAAPVIKTCTKDTWVKVTAAGGVTTATIHRLSVAPNLYRQTFVLTGASAPTDDSTAALMFSDSPNEEIVQSGAAIDYYVKAVGAAGSVRVDA